MSAVHPAVAAPLAALDAAGVRWCLLRGEAGPAPPSGDLDLLVAAEDLGALRAALAALGAFAEPPEPGRSPHHAFLGYSAEHDVWIKLDVITGLWFGRRHELRTPAAEEVLARRRRSGELAVPAPVDAFWAGLLHILLDGARLRPRRAAELAALAAPAATEPSALADLVGAACPPGWDAAAIAHAAAAGRWDELRALASHLSARWPGTPRRVRARRVATALVLRRAGTPLARARVGAPGVTLTGGDAASRAAVAAALAAAWPTGGRVTARPGVRTAMQRRRGRLVVATGGGSGLHVDLGMDAGRARRAALGAAWRWYVDRTPPRSGDRRR